MGPRPPIGASAIAGTVLFALVLAVPGILADPDTLWQIHTGDLILRTGAIPHADPFSYTAQGERWFAHEWLAETLMALANRTGGWRGVMTLTAAAAGVTMGLLLYHLRRFMALLPAVAVMLLGIANCAGSLLARPHVLAWPCLELWCAGLVIARARGRAPSWWLLPVMVVWVNLHGSFMLGLLLPLAFLIEAAIEAGPAWRQPVIQWARFTAAAWAAALLNPDTFEALLFPFQLLGMQNLNWIGEWSPADFSAFHPLELTILVLLGIGLMGRLTVPPFRLLMLLGLVHMALKHWRHDQLLGLIGALILAEAIGRLAPPEPAAVARRMAVPLVAALAAILALTGRILMPLGYEPGGAVFATLEKVPAVLREKPVLNDYGFGALLIAHGDRPFIDSRADMYGDAFLGRFRQIADGNPGALTAALEQYHVAWTIFPPDAPVLLLLDQLPGWHRLLTEPAAVVHMRDDPGESRISVQTAR
ncbi:MAG: hypothetical protein EXR07_14880 [Acetobacteraceae bacterium]|nr:hypothetical protein [Acetobacteraceae bacterium]